MKNILEYENFINEFYGKNIINQAEYDYYVVNTIDNKIWSGWEYETDAHDNYRELKQDFENANLKVLTRNYLLRKNIKPNDNDNWTNEIDKQKYK